jgi:hypothetical protein
VFKSDLTSQLPDSVHQIFPLPVDYLGYVVKVALNLLVLSLNLVNLLLFNVEFVLLATEVLVQIQFDVLLRNQFLLQLQLLSPPLLQLGLRLQQLLLLLHRLLHHFGPLQQFALHVFDFLE